MSKKTLVILLGGIILILILIFTFLQKNNNVTSEWEGFYLEQTSKTSATQYAIYSIDGTLVIKIHLYFLSYYWFYQRRFQQAYYNH